ncbi:MAG: trimethylamine methyltransferase family protein, partial [Gemmatimonadaceae bacterium]
MPLMDELVRDKHLLMSEHTLAHWPEELYLPGPMVDRTNWDQWEVQGSRDWRARALEVIDETLGAYDLEPLPSAITAEIQGLITKTCQESGFAVPAFDAIR